MPTGDVESDDMIMRTMCGDDSDRVISPKFGRDGRQWSLKISANATYGFTGTGDQGMLPCVEVSRSVTGYGRALIDATIQPVDTGKVINGDTNSVMIKMEHATNAEAMAHGKRMAVEISTHYPPPIKLEFEKVYNLYLLVRKKKYVGAYFSSNPDKPDKMDVKGVKIVRRDCSPYMSRLLTMESNKEKSLQQARRAVSDLFHGRVDIKEFSARRTVTSTTLLNTCHT